MVRLRSSTPIKVANLPPPNSSKRLKTEAAGSAWMVAEFGGTMFLLNEYGNP